MKNIVVCFDSTTNRQGPRDATNAETLFRLLDADDDRQLTWYDSGEADLTSPRMFNPMARGWRDGIAATARQSVVDAYFHLAEHWVPEDRIFLLGAGRGAYCARTLARLLDTFGLLDERDDNVVEYALAAFALPSIHRTSQDWAQIKRLACALSEERDVSVPVHFIGLWDTVKVPGTPALCEYDDSLSNVTSGRHAVAIDGGAGPFGECRVGAHPVIEEAWFRGTHGDVVGGPNAYWPLADITMDWMLDGVVKAGALLAGRGIDRTPAPTELDALADGARSLRFRKVPEDALVHASVEVYLRANPDYWRRLPYRVVWTDLDWTARAERMPSADTAPAQERDDAETLTAVAS